MSNETEELDLVDHEAILLQKIRAYRNAVYDASLDIKVADVTDIKEQKTQAEARMKSALKVIDFLEGILAKMHPEKSQ